MYEIISSNERFVSAQDNLLDNYRRKKEGKAQIIPRDIRVIKKILKEKKKIPTRKENVKIDMNLARKILCVRPFHP